MQQRSLGVLTLILAYGFSIDGTSTRLAVANNGPWPLPQVTSPADNPSTPEKKSNWVDNSSSTPGFRKLRKSLAPVATIRKKGTAMVNPILKGLAASVEIGIPLQSLTARTTSFSSGMDAPRLLKSKPWGPCRTRLKWG